MRELSPADWAVLPLKKFAVLSGRAPRAEYWWFYLATVIIQIPIELAAWSLETEWPSWVYSLALMIPFISVTVRRLHDTDRSGWWLVAAIPIAAVFGAVAVTSSLNGSDSLDPWMIAAVAVFAVYAIALFIFTVLPGNEGPNRYGPDPYGPDGLEEVFA